MSDSQATTKSSTRNRAGARRENDDDAYQFDEHGHPVDADGEPIDGFGTYQRLIDYLKTLAYEGELADLTASELNVLRVLASFASQYTGVDARPAMATLRRMTKYDLRTLRKAIKGLLDKFLDLELYEPATSYRPAVYSFDYQSIREWAHEAMERGKARRHAPRERGDAAPPQVTQ